ncbi:hypothetical protein F2Q70_00010922 [Brassica cretica]|uniref:Uncharacterized protein n=1 Tax=Brassica cretica TaxID=69181 RepID=A0A8S9LW24_BRACR|nr:hypothetical protein F2Q70_00010922 [Brassica cretica]
MIDYYLRILKKYKYGLKNLEDELRSAKDVSVANGGEAIFACDWDFMSSIEEQLKQSKEKLRCGKAVSVANEIRREA